MTVTEILTFDYFILDLDNTLYNETDYLKLVYGKISETVSGMKKNVSQNEVFEFLMNEFAMNGRSLLFDKLLAKYNLEKTFIDKALNILRTFDFNNKMELSQKGSMLLNLLSNKRVAVLTNGNIQQQRNKVRLINWQGFDHTINFVYAYEFEPKPSRVAVDYILNTFLFKANLTLFIGDSSIDSECATVSGIKFCYIKDILTDNI